MTVRVEMDLNELKAAQWQLEQKILALNGPAADMAMRTAVLLVQRDAKINAPVDTGRLRASIIPEVTSSHLEVVGVVGSNVIYAPYQELGTKKMRGKRYLLKAFEQNSRRIYELFNDIVRRIVNG